MPSSDNYLLTALPLFTTGLINDVISRNTKQHGQKAETGETDGLDIINITRWRHCTKPPLILKSCKQCGQPQRAMWASLIGKCLTSKWSIFSRKWQRDVCVGAWQERSRGRGWAAIVGDGTEQGVGIKSAFILNYSRDKNLFPKRPPVDHF